MTRHLLHRLTIIVLLLAAVPLLGQVPYQVKVINPTYSASIRDAVGMNGIGYFVAGSYLNFSNGQWDEELWRTDGTEAGTFRVKDIRVGDLGSNIKWMTVVGNTLYFSANDGTTGDELWKSDGTAAGTVRVVELSVGSGGGGLQSLVEYNGALYFIGTYANGNTYLFRSDGTAAGTVPVSTAVVPFAPTSVNPDRRLTVWNGYLWFMGADIPYTGSGLYRSDGTSAGTTRIQTLNSPGSDLVAASNQLFFTANDPTYRREVWRSDGTAAGTYMTKDLNPINSGFNGDSSAWIYWTVGDVCIFSAVDGNAAFNRKLYRSDGTTGGTYLLADIYPGASDVTNNPRTNADRTYMVWESSQQGASGPRHLYVTDGTIAGTARLKTFLSFCQNFMPMDGVMYFRANDGSAAGGTELWRTNGTVAGTYRYADINPGPNGSDPYPVGFFGNLGLLHAGPSYPQLWAFRLCNSAPQPVVSAPAAVCSGNGAGTATVTNAASFTTFNWTILNGAFDSPVNGSSVSFHATSSSAVQLTVTATADGCQQQATVSIPTAAPSTPVITASGPTTFCEGGSVTLTASSGSSYAWSTGATTQSITVNASGSYSVTVTDTNGCSATSAATVVTVNPLPSPVITVANQYTMHGPVANSRFAVGAESVLNYCGSVDVNLIVSQPMNYTSFLWSTGATTPSIHVTSGGTYTVTVTNANGCSASDSVTINVTPAPPAPAITASSTELCPNGSVTLTASAADSYLWSTGATTQSITVTQPGFYSVNVTANGCTSPSSSINIGQRSISVTASGPTTFCAGGSVTLTASAADSYLWSNGATTQSINVTSSGDYSVVGSFNDGCSIPSSSVAVSVSSIATSISADRTTVCPGGSIQLTSSVTGGPAASYQWYGSGGSPISGATSATYTLTPADGGYIYLVATDANGCSATSNAILYNVSQPSASIAVMGPATFCEGGSTTLMSSPGASYLWSTGETSQFINVTQSGSYTVTVTNADGCSATSAPTTITVNPNPATPAITASGPTTFCEGGSVTLTAPSGYMYAWSNGATTQSIVVNASGSYSVTLTNANGCSATSAATVVTVNPLPPATITAGGPTTFCPGGSVMLTAPAGYSYAWSNGATTQSIIVSASGNYSVTVTSASSCSRTSAPMPVTVNPATVITSQPQSITIRHGNDTGTLSVTATGTGTLQYQWYRGTTGNTSQPAGTGPQLSVGPYTKKGTYPFWVRVTSTTCTGSVANSVTANVTVN